MTEQELISPRTSRAVVSIVGPTQLELMSLFWLHGPMSARRAHKILAAHRYDTEAKGLAYTTVTTTLNRLANVDGLDVEEDQLLVRYKAQGSAGYWYRALLKPEDYINLKRSQLEEAIDVTLDKFR